jgi:hypothetical protein
LLTQIVFRGNEDYQREVECELLLVECRLKQGRSWADHLASYSKVQEKVAVRGMPYRGRTVAKAEWRLAQACWNAAVKDNNLGMKKQALNEHYRRTIFLHSIEEVMLMVNTISWTHFE